jgi:hypothetical protein
VNVDIKLLMEFLDQVGPEASGRAVAGLEEGTDELLRRFARGQCTTKEREQACRIMHERPQLVRMVAAELKRAKPVAKRTLNES